MNNAQFKLNNIIFKLIQTHFILILKSLSETVEYVSHIWYYNYIQVYVISFKMELTCYYIVKRKHDSFNIFLINLSYTNEKAVILLQYLTQPTFDLNKKTLLKYWIVGLYNYMSWAEKKTSSRNKCLFFTNVRFLFIIS